MTTPPRPDPRTDPLLSDLPEHEGFKVLDGRYVIFDVLGQGGMGVVYRGKHLGLGLQVAIKCLDPVLARRDPQFVMRFEQEARAAARVDDPHVVRVHDVASTSGIYYMSMQYVQGENARQRVQRKRQLSVDEAITIAMGATQGLAAAHKAGLVHRDVKPDNILISTAGEVKLADLGLAKIEGDSGMTYSGATMGTPRYMPPEQYDDAKRVGPEADVYGMGATLYFLLAGEDGISGKTLPEVLKQVGAVPFPRARDKRPEVDLELDELIARCVEKDPELRPRDGAELAELLAPFALGVSGDLSDEQAMPTLLGVSMVSPPPEQTLLRIQMSLAGESAPAAGGAQAGASEGVGAAAGLGAAAGQQSEGSQSAEELLASAATVPMSSMGAADAVAAGQSSSSRLPLVLGAAVIVLVAALAWTQMGDDEPAVVIADLPLLAEGTGQEAGAAPGGSTTAPMVGDAPGDAGHPDGTQTPAELLSQADDETNETNETLLVADLDDGPLDESALDHESAVVQEPAVVPSQQEGEVLSRGDQALAETDPLAQAAVIPALTEPEPADAEPNLDDIPDPTPDPLADVAADPLPEPAKPTPVDPWLWTLGQPAPEFAGLTSAGKNDQGYPEYDMPLSADVQLRFVLIPAGSFTMGSAPGDEHGRPSESPQQSVTLEAFLLARTECTQEQYAAVMGFNPSLFAGCGAQGPVESLSWLGAGEFCAALGLSLPSEAQWEYACRAGSTTALYKGSLDLVSANHAPALHPLAWYAGNSEASYQGVVNAVNWDQKQFDHETAGTLPTASREANVFGLYDMLGNVWEWCADTWSDDHAGASPDGSPRADLSEVRGVRRGGSFSSSAADCRSASRRPPPGGGQSGSTGFRPLKTLH